MESAIYRKRKSSSDATTQRQSNEQLICEDGGAHRRCATGSGGACRRCRLVRTMPLQPENIKPFNQN